VEDKMIKNLHCPICRKEIYSGIGNGCKMCGMAVEDKEEFCCKICFRKYSTINNKLSERNNI